MIKEKIRELRILYEEETASLKAKHDADWKTLNNKLSKAKDADYFAPYIDHYQDFCSAMEEYYKKLCLAEKDIHGLDFYVEKYLPQASIQYHNEKNVEEMFEALVVGCKKIVEELELGHAVKEYAALLRAFCDQLATMRYIVKNSRELLKKSGFPENDKREAVDAIEEEIDSFLANYIKTSKFDNLKCYPRLAALKQEFEDIYEKTSSSLLGVAPIEDDGQYRYLLGFYIEKLEECDAVFCENILGVNRAKIGREPVYFEPSTGRANIIINAPHDFLSGNALYELIRNLYFSLAGKLDKGMLQYGYIDCRRGSSPISSIYNDINTSGISAKKRLGENGIFCYDGVNIFKNDGVKKCLEKIENDSHNIVNNCGNLFHYNSHTERNKLPLKLVVINLYPLGFTDASPSEQAYQTLKEMMTAYKESGCMFVVCQDINDPLLKKEGVRLTGDECSAVEITLEESAYKAWSSSGKPLGQCEFTIDGQPALMDITSPDFSEADYWEALRKHYSEKKIYSLREIFKKVDAQTNNWQAPPSPFDSNVIEIPLGLNGPDDYCLRYPLSSAGHTLIYGGSGSGKSSFLHTLILSMCYKYSAEDIQIYLADFKETEFSFYEKNRLPHIKYYLCKNGVSEVCDCFDMIDRIRKQRGDHIKKYGCSDIIQYNKKAKDCTDKGMEKMPVLFFIIDEYQVIESVTGAGRAVMEKINQKISTILSQARSVGINLFLCAQNLEKIGDIDTANVYTYILMGEQKTTDRYIRQFFLNNDYNCDLDDVKDFLAVKNEGRCLIKSIEGRVADKVRVAYAGKDSKTDRVRSILSLPREENKKPIFMVLGGSEEPVAVSEYANYRKELLRNEPSMFNLNLGIGSTSGLPSALSFNVETEGCGWMLYSEHPESVYHILRNTILAFLYKTSAIGYRYHRAPISQRILYFGENRCFKLTIGERFLGNGDFSFVQSHIKMLNVNREVYEICSQILALYDEMNRRRDDMDDEGVIFSETTDYPPYLVILQSLKWLESENISQILKEQQAESKRSTEATIEDVDDSSIDDILKHVYSGFGKKAPEKKAKSAERMTFSSVIKALTKLFEDGSRYGIFVLMNPEDTEKARDAFGSEASWGYKYWDNAVYGTFEDFNETEEDPNEANPSGMVCYVGKSRTKTRMYDYSLDTQSGWWDELERMMEAE